MNVLVLIKYSLDVSEIKVDPDSADLLLEGVPRKIGDIDKNVVEAAVQLTADSNSKIQALTLGPLKARDGFRDVLAMGLDEVILIEDPFDGQAESVVAITILEAAIKKITDFDLIICGFASDDGYTFQVAPRLAERLNLPLVSYVSQLSVEDDSLIATRELDDSLQVISVPLPAVVSIAEEAFPPRRTTLMDALKAKDKPVNVWHVGDELDLDLENMTEIGKIETAYQKGVIISRKRNLLKGKTPVELADQLIDALLKENVIKGNE